MPKRTAKLHLRILPTAGATLRRPARGGRRRRVRFVPVVALALVALGMASVAGAQEAPPAATPRAALTSDSGAPGDTVRVGGENWPAASVVQAQLCGNEALNGLADCLRSTAVTQVTDGQGSWSAELPVLIPPKPCPCVVYVTMLSGSSAVRLPFEVLGVPTATPAPAGEAGTSTATPAPAREAGTSTAEAAVGSEDQSVPGSTSAASSSWPSAVPIALLVVGLVAVGVILLVRRRRRASSWGDDELGSRTGPAPSIPPARGAAEPMARGTIGATVGATVGATGGPPSLPLDHAALEEDLAEELGRAMARVGTIGPDDDPDLVAASIAAEVAPVVGARHHLDPDAVEGLASNLRASLAAELGSVASGAL